MGELRVGNAMWKRAAIRRGEPYEPAFAAARRELGRIDPHPPSVYAIQQYDRLRGGPHAW